MNKTQIESRITHPDWPECLQDLFAQWHCFIELGEYDNWDILTIKKIDTRISEMDNRFIRTFFPEIPY